MNPKLPYEGPTKPYVFGATYEIRDRINRVVIRFQVLKGDLTYRKNLGTLAHVISGLLNGEKWIENDGESLKLFSLGQDGPETIEKFITVKVPAISVPTDIPKVEITEQPKDEPKTVALDESLTVEVEDSDDEDAVVGGAKSQEVLNHVKQKRKPGRPKGS